MFGFGAFKRLRLGHVLLLFHRLLLGYLVVSLRLCLNLQSLCRSGIIFSFRLLFYIIFVLYELDRKSETQLLTLLVNLLFQSFVNHARGRLWSVEAGAR